jgi:hypothetical protein
MDPSKFYNPISYTIIRLGYWKNFKPRGPVVSFSRIVPKETPTANPALFFSLARI